MLLLPLMRTNKFYKEEWCLHRPPQKYQLPRASHSLATHHRCDSPHPSRDTPQTKQHAGAVSHCISGTEVTAWMGCWLHWECLVLPAQAQHSPTTKSNIFTQTTPINQILRLRAQVPCHRELHKSACPYWSPLPDSDNSGSSTKSHGAQPHQCYQLWHGAHRYSAPQQQETNHLIKNG
jgi:hypothetical protein